MQIDWPKCSALVAFVVLLSAEALLGLTLSGGLR